MARYRYITTYKGQYHFVTVYDTKGGARTYVLHLPSGARYPTPFRANTVVESVLKAVNTVNKKEMK